MSEALRKLQLQLATVSCIVWEEASGQRAATSPSTAAATIPRNEAKSRSAGLGLPFFVFSGSNT
jgi:hypothetical protein